MCSRPARSGCSAKALTTAVTITPPSRGQPNTTAAYTARPRLRPTGQCPGRTAKTWAIHREQRGVPHEVAAYERTERVREGCHRKRPTSADGGLGDREGNRRPPDPSLRRWRPLRHRQ